MKVVHLTTSINGGAGIAAIRLHKALLQNGVDSKVLCLKGEYPLPQGVEKYYERISFIERLARFIHRKWELVFPSSADFSREEISKVEVFSSPYTEFRPENHPILRSADIIHLHWVAGFINYSTFFSKINVPIFWTFHDMNPFLGGYHYSGDIGRGSAGMNDLDIMFRKFKRVVLNEKVIYPIYLSHWIREKAGYFDFQLKGPVIPNCIDFQVFRNFKGGFREVFEIPSDKIVFLFVAERINNRRKGLVELLKIVSTYKNKAAHFVALGEFDENFKSEYIQLVPTIRDERYLNLLYNSVNYLIIPSIEDNLPNTMLEALASGCGVISSANGGMIEHVQSGKNGWIYNSFDELFDIFDKAIINSINQDSESIRRIAEKKFCGDVIATKIMVEYENVVKK